MMQNAKKVIIIEKMTEQKTPERIKKNQLSSQTPHKKAGTLEWSGVKMFVFHRRLTLICLWRCSSASFRERLYWSRDCSSSDIESEACN